MVAGGINNNTLKLLDVTLKPSGAVIKSVIGEFTGTGKGQQEIALLKSDGRIEIWSTSSSDTAAEPGLRLLKSTSRSCSMLRSAVAVRLGGSKRDLLIVGADGGCLSVLDFSGEGVAGAMQQPKILHCPAFGKTGCRRETPGQYLAADPKGRAIMIAAIEKRKLVYVLNQSNEASDNGEPKTTIASPLEAHKSNTITFDLCGLDNGYDNPIFAALELTYSDEQDFEASAVQKQLAYYELDLGLNHVSRRWSAIMHRSANIVAAVPGGSDGPGGVLVAGEDWVEYVHENLTSSSKIIVPLPRRALHPEEKGILTTALTVHRQKKGKFFAICQTELGDAYKISMEMNKEASGVYTVHGMTISLLDTLPIANSLNVTKAGLLFASAEFSDHVLYQFQRIDLLDAPTVSSNDVKASPIFSESQNLELFTTKAASSIACKFKPTMLQSLRIVDTLSSLAPATGVLVGELAGGEVSPQIYTLCGRGPRSSLRVLRHGAAITELAVSNLPGVPGGVFTIKNINDVGAFDKYIIVSFADATLVLSIGETVEEVEDSGFLTDVPTIACSALSDGGFCQVHPGGVRHIKNGGQSKEWQCPGLKRIEVASANSSQVLIALAGGEVVYFELDTMSGALTEASTREMGAEVACLDVGTIAKSRSRSMFAAVGCRDQTCRVVSLLSDQLLSQRSSTALRARPHSVCLQQMTSDGLGDGLGKDDTYLTIGLDDGSAIRALVDPSSGAVGGPTKRFLGARPVGTVRATINNQSCTLLLSSRPWISKSDATGKYATLPLSYVPLDHACQFRSEAIPEAIVATAGKTLRILSVEKANEAFNQTKIELRYTPRQMCLISGKLIICEADHNDIGEQEKHSLGFDASGTAKNSGDGEDMDMDEGENEANDAEEPDEVLSKKTTIRGPMPLNGGRWGSCIRVVDPSSASTFDVVELGKDEAALCCCSVQFHSRGGEALLAVGTVTGLSLHPLKHKESHIALYRILNDRLQLLHKTLVEDPVLAVAHFQGKLLCGVGKILRLYEMGKKQLLRKTELRGIPKLIKTLQTAGDRAYVGDMQHSTFFVRYDSANNRFFVVANDIVPRCVTAQEILDLQTVAVGDKFGNISILRLPKAADVSAVHGTSDRSVWNLSTSNDSYQKLQVLCHYHVGEVITGMTKASLVAGGSEALVYVTVTGRIGAFLPFTSKDDVDFYQDLESHLRLDAPRLTGVEPQNYRSYYVPVKNIIDGDLCDDFGVLGFKEQKSIADKLDRTIGEIMKKLEDTRNSLL